MNNFSRPTQLICQGKDIGYIIVYRNLFVLGRSHLTQELRSAPQSTEPSQQKAACFAGPHDFGDAIDQTRVNLPLQRQITTVARMTFPVQMRPAPAICVMRSMYITIC